MRIYKEELDFESRPDSNMFKSCSVCGKKAETNKYFHSHYGAVCCNGCRLFFHRVQIQVSDGLQLKCKTDGNCNTSPSKGKRWCLKCRFSKCLVVGMDPKKKTNHKLERKILIKNQSKRMDKKGTNFCSIEMSRISNDEFVGVSSSSSQEWDDEYFERSVSEYECQESPELFENCFASSDRSEMEGDIQSEEDSFQLISESNCLERGVEENRSNIFYDFGNSNEQDQQQQSVFGVSPRDESLDFLSCQSQIIEILDSFTLATSQLKIEARHIINYHEDRGLLDKQLFVSHLTNILKNVSQFASSQKHFASLKLEDQRTLLRKNLPLFLQFIIANYFGETTGHEQLNWIFMGQVSDGITASGLRHRTFDEINNACQLFESPARFNEYKHIINQIRIYFQFDHTKIALIANILLFHTTIYANLSEPSLVRNLFEEAKSLMTVGQMLDVNCSSGVLDNLENLVHLLDRMDSLFGDSLVSTDNSLVGSTLPINANLSQGNEETNWLEQQLKQLQMDYQSTSLPTNFLQEYIRLSTGIEMTRPSENFMDNWLQLSKDRADSLLNSRLFVGKLANHARAKLLSKNHMAAVALSLAYLNAKMSGKEQFKNILGYLGKDQSWEAVFSNVFDLDSLHPIKLNELNCGLLDNESIYYFDSLVADLSGLIGEERLFYLFLLLVLLNPEGVELDSMSLNTLLEIRQFYLGQFQRELMSFKSLSLEYSNFQKIIVKLRVFGKLLELFFIKDY